MPTPPHVPDTGPIPRADHRALNALRTIAAALVVLTHTRALLFSDQAAVPDSPVTRVLYALTAMGPAAVLVFFVLSGYWVGGSVLAAFRRGSFRWASYGTARLTRLWIVLIPAIGLTALLDHLGLHVLPDASIYLGDPAYHRTVPAEDLPSHLTPLAALGNALFVQTNLVPTYGTNASLWSLAYEATFYAVLPLALAAWMFRRSWIGGLNLALLVVVCAVGGLDVLAYLPVWLLGAVVALRKDRIAAWVRRMSPRTLALARGVALAALVAALTLTAARYTYPNVVLLALCTTGLVVLLVEDLRWGGRRGRVLDGLSGYAGSSYSLYAVHLPIVALVAAVLVPDAAHRWAPTPAHWATLAAVVAFLLALGWVFAWLTERHTDRVRRAVERRWVRRAPVGSVASGRHVRTPVVSGAAARAAAPDPALR